MKIVFLLLTFISSIQAGTYRPGFYVGSQVGYAWIQAPKSGQLGPRCNFASGKSGGFAYGVFTGINFFNWYDRLCIGIEGGYNDNGYSTLDFSKTQNEYRITSRDLSVTSTFTYVCCPNIDIFLKLGAARVKERVVLHRAKSFNREIPHPLENLGWGIVVNTGIGYSFKDWLNASIAYRGVLHDVHDNLRDRLLIRVNFKGRAHYLWRELSTVQAVYGSLSARF